MATFPNSRATMAAARSRAASLSCASAALTISPRTSCSSAPCTGEIGNEDYLALVGVRQILRTVQHVRDVLLHPLEVMGVLPTLYDARNKISSQSVEALRGYFGERVLPPVRVNAKLKEAPSHKQTIFEYAPESNGAADYAAVVTWFIERMSAVESPTADVHAKVRTRV